MYITGLIYSRVDHSVSPKPYLLVTKPRAEYDEPTKGTPFPGALIIIVTLKETHREIPGRNPPPPPPNPPNPKLLNPSP